MYLHFREPMVTIDGPVRAWRQIAGKLPESWQERNAREAVRNAITAADNAWHAANPQWTRQTPPTWADDTTITVTVGQSDAERIRAAWDAIG